MMRPSRELRAPTLAGPELLDDEPLARLMPAAVSAITTSAAPAAITVILRFMGIPFRELSPGCPAVSARGSGDPAHAHHPELRVGVHRAPVVQPTALERHPQRRRLPRSDDLRPV